MPSSIHLEIYINRGLTDRLVDVVDIEVPGQHVKTLTAACPLIQEIEFSRLGHEKRLNPKKFSTPDALAKLMATPED